VGQNDPFKNLVTGVKKETPVMASSASERSEENNFSVVNNQEQKVSVGELAAQVAQKAFSEAGPGELEKNKKEKGSRWWRVVKEKMGRWSLFGRKAVPEIVEETVAQNIPIKSTGTAVEEGLGVLTNHLRVEDEDIPGDMARIKELLRNSGNEVENMSDEELTRTYHWLASTLAAEKVENNIHLCDLITNRALNEIEERLGKALSPEKKAEIEKKLRGGLSAIRGGQVEKDMIRFGAIIDKSLGEDWYRQNVAEGISKVVPSVT